MILANISITTAGIIESTIIYGIVHTIWMFINKALKHLETDAGQIITIHVKDGHHARLSKCIKEGCIRFGIELDSPHQEEIHN